MLVDRACHRSVLRWCCLLLFLASSCGFTGWPAPASATASLANSGVPVLLLAHVVRLLGPNFHVYVMGAERDRYIVAYTSVAHCAGAQTCAHVHIAGYTLSRLDKNVLEIGTPVTLPDRGPGRYEPARCDLIGVCREANLTFRRGANWYQLSASHMGDDSAFLRAMYRALRPYP
jgi:hypothetical protein